MPNEVSNDVLIAIGRQSGQIDAIAASVSAMRADIKEHMEREGSILADHGERIGAIESARISEAAVAAEQKKTGRWRALAAITAASFGGAGAHHGIEHRDGIFKVFFDLFNK